MLADPAVSPVTTPAELTDATDELNEFQVLADVTFCVVLLENVAVAVICVVCPTVTDVFPVTVTELSVTDGVVVPLLPHAPAMMEATATPPSTRLQFIVHPH